MRTSRVYKSITIATYIISYISLNFIITVCAFDCITCYKQFDSIVRTYGRLWNFDYTKTATMLEGPFCQIRAHLYKVWPTYHKEPLVGLQWLCYVTLTFLAGTLAHALKFSAFARGTSGSKLFATVSSRRHSIGNKLINVPPSGMHDQCNFLILANFLTLFRWRAIYSLRMS